MLAFVSLVAAIGVQGCLRYVPSRTELEAKGTTSNDPKASLNAGSMGGEKEFLSYEQNLSDRLQKLVQARSYLLTMTSTENEYRLGAGDILVLNIFSFNDLTGEIEVTSGGTADLPLIGSVPVLGRSISDVRADVTTRYAKFIRNPRVQLSLKSYQANRVSVIGEVSKPGVYPLRRNGQLLTELLSEAGGRTDKASSRIILLPAPSKSSNAMEATAVGLNGASPSNTGAGVEIEMDQLLGRVDFNPVLVPLLPGDTIVVPEAGTFDVDGEVLKPGSFKLSSRTSAMGAVASAGGFTYSANVKEVEVIRDIGGGRKALLSLDLEEAGLRNGRDVRLRDGDIVRVPSEPGLFMKRQIVETLNGIFRGVGVNSSVK